MVRIGKRRLKQVIERVEDFGGPLDIATSGTTLTAPSTVVFSTHEAISTTGNCVFTAPLSRYYRVQARCQISTRGHAASAITNNTQIIFFTTFNVATSAVLRSDSSFLSFIPPYSATDSYMAYNYINTDFIVFLESGDKISFEYAALLSPASPSSPDTISPEYVEITSIEEFV